jgi:hypothetical protein
MKTTTIKTLLVLAISAFFIKYNICTRHNSKKLRSRFQIRFGVSGGYATQDPYKLALGADARLQYDLTKDTL